MSFSRLRRSKRYDDVIAIYEQVQDKPFFGREVGMSHSKIGVLKSYGDIVPVQDRQKITTTKNISYKVSRYALSQSALSKVREDIEEGKITVNMRPTVLSISKDKDNIIETETIPAEKKIAEKYATTA